MDRCCLIMRFSECSMSIGAEAHADYVPNHIMVMLIMYLTRSGENTPLYLYPQHGPLLKIFALGIPSTCSCYQFCIRCSCFSKSPILNFLLKFCDLQRLANQNNHCLHMTYNTGKNSSVRFVRFGSESLPPFPQCNVDLSHVARGRARLPNIGWWGVGKDMTNGELGGFFKTIHCPKCSLSCKHWDNCNKVAQVFQLFFPGL